MNSESKVDAQTITDFGNQWNEFTENLGYYGSVDCLNDIFCGLSKPEELAGKRVMEIGSGSGRIVNMLLDAGAAKVVAVEPSTIHRPTREYFRTRRPSRIDQ